MNAEIVMIGTELLLGQIADSNATYIGKTLAEHGIPLYRKTTVGDNRPRIADVLREALSRADVVLTSGGLGPTEDDLTREALSDVFGVPLEFRQDVWDEVLERFSFVRRHITENNKKQAMAPVGATIIPNPHGTAPGLICGDSRGEVICMPGVPRELYAMLQDNVIPHIREKHGIRSVIHHRVLKICGAGESWVDSKMGDLMATMSNPQIGVLASPDAVRIRISARAESVDEAERMIDEVDAQVRERMPGLIFGTNDDTIEAVLARLLEQREWSFAVAETYTGGLIAHRMANAACFAGGAVEKVASLDGDGAHAAEHFAQRAKEMFAADCALGVATNPSTRTIHAAFIAPDGQSSWELGYAAIEPLMQTRAAVFCLEHVRRHLTGLRAQT